MEREKKHLHLYLLYFVLDVLRKVKNLTSR
jgi:hypothetical protein